MRAKADLGVFDFANSGPSNQAETKNPVSALRRQNRANLPPPTVRLKQTRNRIFLRCVGTPIPRLGDRVVFLHNFGFFENWAEAVASFAEISSN